MAGSGSDLEWVGSNAPTHGTIGDTNTMLVSPDNLGHGQDVILDSSGTLRSRGGFVSATTDTFTTSVPHAALQSSTGTILISRDASANTLIFGTANANLTSFAQLTAAQTASGGSAQNITQNPDLFTFAKFEDNKGTVLAGDYGFLNTNLGVSALWGGNVATTSDTTTGTAATTIGTKAVVGAGTAWTTALEGCYLFIGAGTAAIYVGQVAQVISTTSLNLVKGALKTIAAAAPAFKTVRPVQYMVYKGRITTNLSSPTVIGSNTKWNSSGPAGSGGVFLTNSVTNLFRYSDGAIIGQISTINNDTTLTLTGNAAIALVNEEYYIENPQFSVTGGPSFLFFGGSTARFADRYWYGAWQAADPSVKGTSFVIDQVKSQPNSLAFTKKADPECLDLDPAAGDTITLPTSHSFDRIRGLCATKGGLVVFRTKDTYLLTGYSPDTFRLIKILDDGINISLGFKEYNEGVVFVGMKSVWYFDGTKVVDLLQSRLRKFFQRSIGAGSLNSPITMAVSNDYAMVGYPFTTGDRTWPVNNTTGTANYVVLVINMLNGSITFFTNLSPTNSFYSDTLGSSVILSRFGAGLSNTTGYLVLGNTIFTDSATVANNIDFVVMNGTITGNSGLGPRPMFETTKLTLGDATRLKTWKRFLLNYSSDVSMTATFIGTNNTTLEFPNTSTGTVSTDTYAANSGTGILHRMRFLVRSPTLSIRVYQTATASAGVSQRFRAYWWSLGGKRMRQGRVNP